MTYSHVLLSVCFVVVLVVTTPGDGVRGNPSFYCLATVHACVKVQANYTGHPFGKLEWEAARRAMESRHGRSYMA